MHCKRFECQRLLHTACRVYVEKMAVMLSTAYLMRIAWLFDRAPFIVNRDWTWNVDTFLVAHLKIMSTQIFATARSNFVVFDLYIGQKKLETSDHTQLAR